jgi:hypothetical protein
MVIVLVDPIGARTSAIGRAVGLYYYGKGQGQIKTWTRCGELGNLKVDVTKR